MSYVLAEKSLTRETDTIEPNSFRETLCKATHWKWSPEIPALFDWPNPFVTPTCQRYRCKVYY